MNDKLGFTITNPGKAKYEYFNTVFDPMRALHFFIQNFIPTFEKCLPRSAGF